jgi:EAL domain-containing protein (putative c-di-GMP-specific phosphodiesterase class I)
VYNRLEQLGCDLAQGNWIKAPASGSDITDWLRNSPWACAPVPLPGAAS